jgi:hypothetical protein
MFSMFKSNDSAEGQKKGREMASGAGENFNDHVTHVANKGDKDAEDYWTGVASDAQKDRRETSYHQGYNQEMVHSTDENVQGFAGLDAPHGSFSAVGEKISSALNTVTTSIHDKVFPGCDEAEKNAELKAQEDKENDEKQKSEQEEKKLIEEQATKSRSNSLMKSNPPLFTEEFP